MKIARDRLVSHLIGFHIRSLRQSQDFHPGLSYPARRGGLWPGEPAYVSPGRQSGSTVTDASSAFS